MREMLSMLLDRAPDLIVAGMAASGQEALAEWSAEEVDLTLLDLSLPDVAGLAVLQELKRRSPSSPVLVLSGDHRSGVVEAVKDAGADGFILKGDPQNIISGIRDVLSGGRPFKTLESL